METTNEAEAGLQPSWGMGRPPIEAIAAYGARAIYRLESKLTKFFDNGKRRKTPIYKTTVSIDFVWDRHEMTGDDNAKAGLGKWLDKVAIPELRKRCLKEYITPDCDAVIEIASDNCVLKASPRESYGYLYITAWKVG